VPGADLPWQRAAVHRAILTPLESHDELFIREVLEARNRESWQRWLDSWTDVYAELEDTIAVEGGMLALVRWRARSPADLEVDQRVAFHLEVRDHMVTRFVSYWERSRALEALGLPTPGSPPSSRYPCTPGARSSAG
jgi:hypothetical protein